MVSYSNCYFLKLVLFIILCTTQIPSGQSDGNIQQRPVPLDISELEEDEAEKKGLVDLDKFKETFNSLFGGEPMQDEQNKCQSKSIKTRTEDITNDDNNEFIDSMKENFDKWNNIIDSMNTGDYDIFAEMLGGEGNEENKIEISQ